MYAMKEKGRTTKGSSSAQEGFISTIFLIAMCVMMALIAAKRDYIMKADMVYRNLEEAENDLYEESALLKELSF